MTSRNRPPATSEVQEVSQRVKDTRKEIDTLKAELQKLISAGSNTSLIKSPSKQNSQVAPLEIVASNREPSALNPVRTLPAAGLPSSNRCTSAQQTLCSRNVTNTAKLVAQKKVPIATNTDLSSKKTKAYDVDEAREYIKKQKEKRAEQLRSQIKVEDNKLDLKRQKLKELQLKTRELVSKNVQMKRERSKSRDKHEPIRLDKADLLKPSTARDRSRSRDRYLLKPPHAMQPQPRARSQERFKGSTVGGSLNLHQRPRSQDRAQQNSPPQPKPERKSKVPPCTSQQREGRGKLRGSRQVPKHTTDNRQLKDSIAPNNEAAQDNTDNVDHHHHENLPDGHQPMNPNLLMPPEAFLEKSMMVFPEKAASNVPNNDESPSQPAPTLQHLLLDHVTAKSKMAARNLTTSNANKKEIQTQTSEALDNRSSANLNNNNSKNNFDLPWLQPGTSTMPYPYNFINTVKRKLQDALHTPTKSYADVAIQSSFRAEDVPSNFKDREGGSLKLDVAQEISSRPKSKEEIKEMLLKSASSYRSHNHSKKQIEFKVGPSDLELIAPPDSNKASITPKTDAPASGVVRKLFLNNAPANVEDSASDTSKNIPEISTESALSSSNKPTTIDTVSYDNKTAEQRILSLEKINELKLVTRSRGSYCQNLTGDSVTSADDAQKPNTDNSKPLSTILSLAEDSYSSDFVVTKSDSTLTNKNDRSSTKSNTLPDIDGTFNHDSVVSSTKKTQKSRLSSENESVSSSAVNEVLSAVKVTGSDSDKSKIETFKTLESEAQPTRTPSLNKNDAADSSISEVLNTAVTSSADVDSDLSAVKEPAVTLVDGKSKSNVATSNSNGDRMRTITIRPSTSNGNNNVNEIHLKFEAEVHLLNDFNESLKQFKAVEEAFKHLQQNDSATTTVAKVLQNVDTQTSFVTRSADSVTTATGTATTTVASHLADRERSPRSTSVANQRSPVNGQLSSGVNDNHSLVNYSRGSDILEELDDLNGAFLKAAAATATDTTLSTTGLLDLSRINESAVSSKSDSQLQLSVSNVENDDFRHCTGLSLNMFEQLIKEEDARIEHLKVVIKIREQALLDRTKCELLSLDIKRKELLETGKLEEASLIKKKQRGILLKHEQERNEIKRLKQMQKDASKERKQILKQQRNIIKTQLSTKDMLMMSAATSAASRQHHRRHIQKSAVGGGSGNNVGGGAVGSNRDNNMASSSRRQSGPLRVVTSQSQQHQQHMLQQSCSESIYSETSIVSRRSSLRNSFNGCAGGEEVLSVTSCSSKTTRSVAGAGAARVLSSASPDLSDLDISGLQRLPSLPPPPTQEGAVPNVAAPAGTNYNTTNHTQVADVKRALFMKEAALQRRRKEVEELLKWNQKLLEEEKKIAELEEAANAVINQRPSPPIPSQISTIAAPSNGIGSAISGHSNRKKNTVTTSTLVDDKSQPAGTGTNALGSHKFSGKQLNQLWKNMTGRDDKRYPDDKIYVMSQITLERFCKSARQFAARNRKNTIKTNLSERSEEDKDDDESHLSQIIGEPITQLDRSASNNNNNNNNNKNNDDSINIDSNRSISEEIDFSDQEQYSSAFEPESVQEILVDHSTNTNKDEDSGERNKISSISELIDNFSRIEDEISLLSRKTERNLERSVASSEQMIQEQEQSDNTAHSVDPLRDVGIVVGSQCNVAASSDSFIEDLSEPPDEISAETRHSTNQSLPQTMSNSNRTGSGDNSSEANQSSRSFSSKDDNLEGLLSHEEIPAMKDVNDVDSDDDITTVISSNEGPESNDGKVGERVPSDSVAIVVVVGENSAKDEHKVSSEKEQQQPSSAQKVDDDECCTTCEITSRSLDSEAQDVPQIFAKTANDSAVVLGAEQNGKNSAQSAKISLHNEENQKKTASEEVEDEKVETPSTEGTQDANSSRLLSRDLNDNIGQLEISKNQDPDLDQLVSASSEIEESNSSDNNTSNIISEEIEHDDDAQQFEEDSPQNNTDSSPDILVNVEIDVRIESKKIAPTAENSENSASGSTTDGASNLKQQLSSLAEILSTVESSIGHVSSTKEKLTEKESASLEPKEEEEDAKSVSEKTSKPHDDKIKSASALGAPKSASICSEELKTPAKIDVKKRVSEILADANLTRAGDKSPRFEDIYVTVYDVPTTGSLSSEPLEAPSEAKLLSNTDIFGTEAEELLRKQLAIEQEIKQLEQQQKEQHQNLPYAFVREIPNKPPPPYTPPSSSASSSPTSAAHTIVPVDPKEIDDVTNYTSKVLYKAYQLNNLQNVKFSESSFRLISKMNTGKTCCEFLFNICRELAQEHYRQFVKVDEPSWLQVTKKPQLAAPKPYNAIALERYMNRKLKEHFGFRKVETVESSVIKWGRKKRDHVDEILVAELQEEEPQWTNYDKDELLVKDQMVQDIMSVLLKETGGIFKKILEKRRSDAAST